MFRCLMQIAWLILCGWVSGGLVAGEIEVKPQTKPLDPANMDLSVKPSDNFYLYANGSWLKNNPIPAEYSVWGGFMELVERNNAVLHGILEAAAAQKDAPKGSITQKVGDFYASGMDEARIETDGVRPLLPEFARIAEIRDRKDLARELAHAQEIGTGAGFVFTSDQDAKDSNSVIAQSCQGGLGLPDRDYYFKDDADSIKLRAAYVEFIRKMFVLLGDAPGKADAEAHTVMDLETKLAHASMMRVEMRNPEATYHKMPMGEVRKLMPNFPWDDFLAELKMAAPAVVNVAQPKFFAAFDEDFVKIPLADWKTYLRWHLISSTAPYLSKAFVDESFDFEGRLLTGAQQLKPRWKRVMGTIEDCVGEALGQLYVEKTFGPEAKARALALVENLRAALRGKIEQLTWMGADTKKAALKKLDAMRVKIGYPDKWRDYSALDIDRGPYVRNVLRSAVFEFRRELAKIGKPVDRGEWQMIPPTVNAYYDPAMNEIVFPAGILQPPFFDAKADDAVNYGGIGAVIGHEMTHGFDDQGRKFDAEGNLENWWTPEDLANFRQRSQAIVDQFNGYTIIDDLKVNGELTQGENIADLGGIKIAESALEKAMAGKPEPPPIDGFDWRQRFFLSFAQVWRANVRDEAKRLRGKTDPHSPPMDRVIGPLSNLPEFSQAFHCPPDSPMVRPEAKRVNIW
jgi:predicted metalloendopeptidase